jgi:hypothetical protein
MDFYKIAIMLCKSSVNIGKNIINMDIFAANSSFTANAPLPASRQI